IVLRSLKGQNMTGGVPSEFAKLRYLQHLDLSRNYLSGSIPRQWAKMSLVDMSFMGNRLSGPFPTALTRVTTLVNLSLEGNQFSGLIPSEIGRLVNLQKLVLSSNFFTGKLPEGLANLTSIRDLRFSDNNFTGKVPDFIGNWTQIEKLAIQGCSLKGPIPSSISALTSLTDLRISDLVENTSAFPPLSKMKFLKVLILRSCLIQGEIPEYIGHLENLKDLDLSFNNLTGPIPASFAGLSGVDFMYLAGNQLSGQIPRWLLERNKNVDVSFNNFTLESSSPVECPRGSVNLVESYSSAPNNLIKVNTCLKRDYPCSDPRKQRYYSLHINCGGRDLVNDNVAYEADLEARGASMFYSRQNWAFSSTGNFMDNDLYSDKYIGTSVSAVSNSTTLLPELYATARASPLSLTYYGLCLLNGNYTVRLHFAEITFTNDTTFASLGRRVFDVYLQESLVLKDFDIAAEAGGPGMPIVKTFPAVVVSSHSLKIHLYWTGRGTTGIPYRGNYGPLISAISVDPNFKPPSEHKKLEAGVVVGIVAAAICSVTLILFILHIKGCFRAKQPAELSGLDLQTGLFTLRQIKAATNNFDPALKLGEGGFGSVYKGSLSDGTIIAVKQLSSKSKQGIREFVTEMGMISALQHPNLVKLYGCCVEGNQLMLIYEYMENNCLSRALFGKDRGLKAKLDWATRRKICLGIARGLYYLHEESSLKIVHRDIKASNVLLDKDMNAKISDFGLAKLNEDGKTHISTRIAGTIGYMSPEYAMRGYLTPKADVYSFGVVVLETLSGKSNTNYKPNEDSVYLLDWAYVLQERGRLPELLDPELRGCSPEEAMLMLSVALLCTNAAPTLRPTMSQVVSMLEGRTAVEDVVSQPGFSMSGSGTHFWE
ncbi:hypothetical protein M569_02055, partial [Genlisea aurea]